MVQRLSVHFYPVPVHPERQANGFNVKQGRETVKYANLDSQVNDWLFMMSMWYTCVKASPEKSSLVSPSPVPASGPERLGNIVAVAPACALASVQGHNGSLPIMLEPIVLS